MGVQSGEKVSGRVGTMPRGKKGKKQASLKMSEDSSLLEEVDMHVDSIEEVEEATMDSHTMEEFIRSLFGENTEVDFGEMTGMDLELRFDRAEPTRTKTENIIFHPFHDSF
jgi:hypothetical protein